MKNASKVCLGELLRLERRPVKVIADNQYSEIGIYCFGRGIFHKAPRSGLEVGNKDLFLVREGDFILQITFAWEGAVGLATKSDDGMYCSTRFPTFRVDESRCFPPYLVHYFKTHEGREQLVKISPGSAGRNRVLSLKRIPEVYVPLPQLSEQERIVAKVEKLAAKIEEARALRQQAIEEAEAVIDVSYLEVFQNPDLKPYLLSLGEADLRINQESRDPRQYYSKEFAYVDISSVGKGPSILKTAKTLPTADAPSRARRVIHRGDIIFSTVRPNLRAISKIGSLLDGQMCSTGFAVLSPGATLDSNFLLYQLCSSFFIDQCVAKTTGGHYPAINDTNLRKVLIVVPPLSEQRHIVAYLDDLQAKVDALKRLQAETQTELNAMLPSVLDKAFKGELA